MARQDRARRPYDLLDRPGRTPTAASSTGRRGALPDRGLPPHGPLPDEPRQRHRPLDVRHLRRRADRRPGRCRRQPVPLRDRGPAPRRPPPHRARHPGPRRGRERGAPCCGSPSPTARDADARRGAQPLQERHRQPAGLRGDQPRPRLAFRYRWAGCDEFGWVRTATLENRGTIRGAGRAARRPAERPALRAPRSACTSSRATSSTPTRRRRSTPRPGWGSSRSPPGSPTGRRPLEVLRANTVWCCGLEGRRVHLSGDAVDAFRQRPGAAPEQTVLNGARGNYLVSSRFELEPRPTRTLAPRRRRRAGTTSRSPTCAAHPAPDDDLGDRRSRTACDGAGESLRRIVGQRRRPPADRPHRVAGSTTSPTCCSTTCAAASSPELRRARRPTSPTSWRCATARAARPGSPAWPAARDQLTVQDLLRRPRGTGRRRPRAAVPRVPAALLRPTPRRPEPALEPLRDPASATATATAALHYEGNWRDIFQNWEALCASFPGSCPSIVAKFVNASTVDGFNPYRITRDGVDWEIVDPDDPWSNIGYWGDHQIIYLLKLLEALDRARSRRPARTCWAEEIFSYADVPYRIKPYEDILEDPQRHHRLRRRARRAHRGAGGGRRDRRQAADRRRRVGLPRQPAREAAGAGALEAVEPGSRRRHLDEHPAARVERREQRAGRRRRLGGHPLLPAPLPGLPGRAAGRAPAGDAARVRGGRRLVRATATTSWRANADRCSSGEIDRRRDRKRLHGRPGRGLLRLPRDGLRRRLLRQDATCRSSERSGSVPTALRLHRPRHRAPTGATTGSTTPTTCSISRTDGRERRRRPPAGDARGPGGRAQLGPARSGGGAGRSSTRSSPAPSTARTSRASCSTRSGSCRVPGEERRARRARRGRCRSCADLLEAGDGSMLARDADGRLPLPRRLPQRRRPGRGAGRPGGDRRSGPRPWRATARRCSISSRTSSTTGRYTGRSGAMYGYEGLGCIYWHMVAKLLLAVQEMRPAAERDGQPG